MSEPISNPSPNPLTCAACQQQLADQHYRFGERQVCLNCAGQIHSMQMHNRFAAGPWIVGLIVGIVAALACGAVWAAIAYSTKYEIGIIAVGVGIVVSIAVVKATGNRRGRSIQVITVACSMLGIFAGKGLLAVWVIMQRPNFAATDPIEKVLWLISGFVIAPIQFFGFFDVLWYFLGIRAAWQIGKAPAAQLHGPYQTIAPSSPPSIQFDTVEPIAPPPQVPR